MKNLLFTIGEMEPDQDQPPESPHFFQYEENYGYSPGSIFMIFFTIIKTLLSTKVWYSFFYFVQWIIPLFQCFMVYFYTGLGEEYEKTQMGQIIRMIYHIAFFDDPNNYHQVSNITFGIILGIYALLACFLIMDYAFFKTRNHISKTLRITSLIFFEVFIYTFYIPIFFTTGSIITELMNPSGGIIVQFVFCLLVMFIGIFAIYLFGRTINFLSLPSPFFMAAFNNKAVIHLLSFASISALAEGFKDAFSAWFYVTM